MSAATAFPLHPVRASEPFSSLLQKRAEVRAKRGRGKAVSWPPEDQICQVRFFLSNDAPSALGPAQAALQVNHLRSLSTQRGVLDSPPGFHGSLAKRARVDCVLEVSMSTGRPWLHPQKFGLDGEWLVAVGEESTEVRLQQQRELRVLEAFYPRLTSIPDSPAEPVEICKSVDDCVVLTIPLVPIEEEDESDKEPEGELKVLEGNCNSDWAAAEDGKLLEVQTVLPPSRGSPPPLQESSKGWLESSISKIDPKVAAAAAAAAACMAVHKFGANGLVDQELLVEILRNPALLKSLTFLNQSPKDVAVAMYGNDVGTVGQPDMNHHNALVKACQKVPLNAGLPSPVSVLSDWTEEQPNTFFSRTPSNLSDISNRSNVANVSSSMPLKHSYGLPPSREDVARSESTPVHRVHAYAWETEMGNSASHTTNAHTMPIVHVDKPCGMLPPLAPFPSQNGISFNSNVTRRMQPAQVLKAPAPAQNGLMDQQHTPVLDSAPSRSSFSDARVRGIQYENDGSCANAKAGSKTTRLCMYFNTPRGCRYGGSCSFLHQSMNPEPNSIAQ